MRLRFLAHRIEVSRPLADSRNCATDSREKVYIVQLAELPGSEWENIFGLSAPRESRWGNLPDDESSSRLDDYDDYQEAGLLD